MTYSPKRQCPKEGFSSRPALLTGLDEQPEISAWRLLSGWVSTRLVLPGISGNRTGIFFQQIIARAKLLTSNQGMISALFTLVGLTY